ncbi:hypothetical protein L4174_023325 [Photobacterium sp. CCB-ST2H9]|uniref:AfsA-related hotdog domain-containing protein n=1 Tax=unclassified Photobacterium TaxID=2628852 RepID=UPI0020066450|nr:AfsA-related hotdog domain-containing protein [Photobacterium sp. CCB-ST2H9]UTM59627.1 hypothetical protein L4174_023325 [Photobacterium sp. CCB-ST2H9]
MENINTLFTIVGDKLTNYNAFPQCITYSEMIEFIDKGNFLDSYYQIGQGLSEESISFLIAKFERHGGSHLLVNGRDKLFSYASRKETHKYKKENILITSPERVDEYHYHLNLVMDERGELLQDHLTGYHIQGMVLIEAARQAFLAVTEKFFYSDELPSSHYFVINSMNTSYQAFVFAVDTEIKYSIIEHANKPGRDFYSVKIEFFQNETVCTTVDVEFTVFESARLEQKEFQLAQNAISYATNHLESNIVRKAG